ncbi:MAG: bifunctional folylpolyglutamate synthase/dihydrofolate synthase [Propionibacteriaceae bacterium]|nr:bifunctional folylpolyglutamate synthase/dihydrofolate synthase [Propionibacteriaceae bacterium]
MREHLDLVAELAGRWPEQQPARSKQRIEAVLDLLGRPQEAAPLILITGTNGKGSTAIMIDALLRSQGLRVGRFSSPHLIDATERIAVDGAPISPERFDQLWRQIEPCVKLVDERALGGLRLTFFEAMTALAYAVFADAPVDVMVVEVGMGGGWDATNVAAAQVGVVTPIALDHTQWLGDSLAQIAAEKAGVIQADATAVLAGQDPEAAAVLLRRCAEVGATAWREGIDFGLLDRQLAVGGQVLRLTSAGGPLGDLWLPLHGAVMARNAALALASADAFNGGRGLDPAVVAEGLAEVVAPARTELVHASPPIVIDTCHNPAAVQATLATMDEAYAFAPQVVVWGAMADKDSASNLELLEPVCAHFIATQADSPRALSAAALGELARERFGPERVTVAPELADALDRAVAWADQAGPGAGVLVAGSVALAGAARRLLAPDKPLAAGTDDSPPAEAEL